MDKEKALEKIKRYTLIARWWNGRDWDITKKEIDTKSKVVGAVKLLLKETNPYQISITDNGNKRWKILIKGVNENVKTKRKSLYLWIL